MKPVSQGDFERILPGLLRWSSGLRGPQHPVNSYVIARGDSGIVIDPAGDLTPEVLRDAGVESVSDILITHLQAENVEGAHSFSGARVHLPAGDEYLADGSATYEKSVASWPQPWEWATRGNFRGHMGGARNERPPARALRVHGLLKEGQTVCDLRVISTPGHGKHAVTLLGMIDGRRVAFCADLVFGDGKLWNWFDCEWDYGAETGQRSLIASATKVLQAGPDLLCPTHGPVIDQPALALGALRDRLNELLAPASIPSIMINFPEQDSAATGFRQITPRLHQWRGGNCAVLVSQSGHALMFDDGLCHWSPIDERRAHHRRVIENLKRSLNIASIEIVIPTHYHGDHVENIPDLVRTEQTRVVSLDAVADPLEHPERFNLACLLRWYGTGEDRVKVDQRVRDGEVIRWREYEIEVFHLGGQTWYHAGMQVKVDGRRVLFVGDAISGHGAAPDPVFCYNDADPETRGWASALDRMISRRPDLLVCGHGFAVRDPMPLLRAKRAAWEVRLEQFRQISARDDLRAFFDPFWNGVS